MEVPLRCPPIPRKSQTNRGFLVQSMGQRSAVGQGQLRTQMRNHADHRMFTTSEMKRTLPGLTVTRGLALKLGKQACQIHPPRCKYTQIAVQRKNKFIRTQGHGGPDRNSFLTNARKPFGNLSLTKEDQHFLFDQAWQQQAFV